MFLSIGIREQKGNQDLQTWNVYVSVGGGGGGGGGGVSPQNIVSVSLFISPHLHLTCHPGMPRSDQDQPLVLSLSLPALERSKIKPGVIKRHQH